MTSIAQAAQEIVALVNSRPSSPRPEEIEAIIAKVGSSAQTAASYDREAMARWDQAVRAYVDGADGTDDERAARLLDQLEAATIAVWQRPVRSWADVVLRAAVVCHWNTPGNAGDPPYPDCIIAEGYAHQFDEYAVAMVMRGILDLAGLQFDNDGRLKSSQS